MTRTTSCLRSCPTWLRTVAKVAREDLRVRMLEDASLRNPAGRGLLTFISLHRVR